MTEAHLDEIFPILVSFWVGIPPLHLHFDLALPEGDATLC